MKTLIISSSLSTDSRSYLLCKDVADRLSKMQVGVDLIDVRELDLAFCHQEQTVDMKELAQKISDADNIIFGMGVHCYSINDSLKAILDNCCEGAEGKFFGILCTAGGHRSYLSTMHLTQICMNEWRMMQLPRVIYATGSDFDGDIISSEDLVERMGDFAMDFTEVGKKLLS